MLWKQTKTKPRRSRSVCDGIVFHCTWCLKQITILSLFGLWNAFETTKLTLNCSLIDEDLNINKELSVDFVFDVNNWTSLLKTEAVQINHKLLLIILITYSRLITYAISLLSSSLHPYHSNCRWHMHPSGAYFLDLGNNVGKTSKLLTNNMNMCREQ